jgi:hypothetical protein
MLPGTIVIYDAADGAVKQAGAEADNIVGVLSIQAGESVTHRFELGEQCTVIEHGKCMIRFPAGGTAVAVGSPIVSGANGLGAVQAVGVLGDQGAPFAYGLEANAHAGADFVLCMVTGQRESAPAA